MPADEATGRDHRRDGDRAARHLDVTTCESIRYVADPAAYPLDRAPRSYWRAAGARPRRGDTGHYARWPEPAVIASIYISSGMGDEIEIEASPRGGRIRYSVRISPPDDLSALTYEPPVTESATPLTLGELIAFIDRTTVLSAGHREWTGQVVTHMHHASSWGMDHDVVRYHLSVSSEFYPELADWYAEVIEELWRRDLRPDGYPEDDDEATEKTAGDEATEADEELWEDEEDEDDEDQANCDDEDPYEPPTHPRDPGLSLPDDLAIPTSWRRRADLDVAFTCFEHECVYPGLFDEYRRGSLEDAARTVFWPPEQQVRPRYQVVVPGEAPPDLYLAQGDVTSDEPFSLDLYPDEYRAKDVYSIYEQHAVIRIGWYLEDWGDPDAYYLLEVVGGSAEEAEANWRTVADWLRPFKAEAERRYEHGERQREAARDATREEDDRRRKEEGARWVAEGGLERAAALQARLEGIARRAGVIRDEAPADDAPAGDAVSLGATRPLEDARTPPADGSPENAHGTTASGPADPADLPPRQDDPGLAEPGDPRFDGRWILARPLNWEQIQDGYRRAAASGQGREARVDGERDARPLHSDPEAPKGSSS